MTVGQRLRQGTETMSNTREIVLIKAAIQPIRRREVFWILSKSQIEHVVQDLPIVPVPFSPRYLRGVAAWQGLVLPVVSLERYFGFKSVQGSTVKRHAIVKTTTSATPTTITRLLIDVAYDLRIRPSITDCVPIRVANEELAARGLQGVYEWGADSLLLLPDVMVVASGGAAVGS